MPRRGIIMSEMPSLLCELLPHSGFPILWRIPRGWLWYAVQLWVVRQNSTPCQGRALWWSPERAMTLGKNGGRWWAARGWGGVGWAWLMSHGGWWWPARTGNSAWHGPAKCNMSRVGFSDLPCLCVSPVIQTHLQTTAPSLSADPWSARGVQDIESDLELMFEAWVVANKDF